MKKNIRTRTERTPRLKLGVIGVTTKTGLKVGIRALGQRTEARLPGMRLPGIRWPG